MKKIAGLFLILIFLLSPVFTVCATEKIVQLTVPGCFS